MAVEYNTVDLDRINFLKSLLEPEIKNAPEGAVEILVAINPEYCHQDIITLVNVELNEYALEDLARGLYELELELQEQERDDEPIIQNRDWLDVFYRGDE